MHVVNSLAPVKFEWNFRYVIFKWISVLGWGIPLWNCPNMNVTGLHWRSINIGSGNGLMPPGNKPYLSQCWPRSLSPYGITRPEWVKIPSLWKAAKCLSCRVNAMDGDKVVQGLNIIYHVLGPWDLQAMILMGPGALRLGPIIDVCNHWKF